MGGWAARGAGAISSLLFIRKKGGGEEEEVTHRLSVLFISKKGMAFSVSIVQELCESRGGRPGLSVLTSLLVSVDVKLH